MADLINTCHFGDCRDSMRMLIDAGVRVQTCVTSPPYWGLRDYGHDGQLGLEETVDEYIANQVEVFRLVRELLADDGTLWVNMGDAYANDGKWGGSSGGKHAKALHGKSGIGRTKKKTGLKPKDLIGQPWRLAFALQADGWYLRQDIIWHKPSPMPESVRDRCTKAHEYIFLLAKSERYYYDADAIKEPVTGNAHARGNGVNPKSTGVGFGHGTDAEVRGRGRIKTPSGWDTGDGNHRDKVGRYSQSPKDEGREAQGLKPSDRLGRGPGWRSRQNESFSEAVTETVDSRNKRSVWTADDYLELYLWLESQPDTGQLLSRFHQERQNKRSVWPVASEPFSGAHFATFPTELIKPCILAGSRPGELVLDPYFGSGTTGQVAESLGRQWVGCELNPAYEAMQRDRVRQKGLGF